MAKQCKKISPPQKVWNSEDFLKSLNEALGGNGRQKEDSIPAQGAEGEAGDHEVSFQPGR